MMHKTPSPQMKSGATKWLANSGDAKTRRTVSGGGTTYLITIWIFVTS
jgi:hypothetical protein